MLLLSGFVLSVPILLLFGRYMKSEYGLLDVLLVPVAEFTVAANMRTTIRSMLMISLVSKAKGKCANLFDGDGRE